MSQQIDTPTWKRTPRGAYRLIGAPLLDAALVLAVVRRDPSGKGWQWVTPFVFGGAPRLNAAKRKAEQEIRQRGCTDNPALTL